MAEMDEMMVALTAVHWVELSVVCLVVQSADKMDEMMDAWSVDEMDEMMVVLTAVYWVALSVDEMVERDEMMVALMAVHWVELWVVRLVVQSVDKMDEMMAA